MEHFRISKSCFKKNNYFCTMQCVSAHFIYEIFILLIMRKLRNYRREIEFSRAVFNFEMTLPDIDEERCYFSETTGAFMLYMHGHIFHEDEITVAKAFADNGFLVVLTPEGNSLFATNKLRKNGLVIYKFSEGCVNGRTYEQRTITLINNHIDAVVGSIEHVKWKNSDIVVIYDKTGLLTEKDVIDGIKDYESHKSNKYRAKYIIVVYKDLSMCIFHHFE